MAASALNQSRSFVPISPAGELAHERVIARAARLVPEDDMNPDMINNGWSSHLCKDVCKASGFSRYDFTVPNMVMGEMATCCCCPKGYKGWIRRRGPAEGVV
ncbi:hypothetical protein HU200_007466 [Digitaria exilis]|uniref:Uncharacterized protein n=1 Tax=Digitaria exilis TaxID=1010633 RepID=A0A835FNY4_9POAL|nr:hypothetical protein HU200_007466 [Digitaria exilis]